MTDSKKGSVRSSVDRIKSDVSNTLFRSKTVNDILYS
jgi:hypothetical protein